MVRKRWAPPTNGFAYRYRRQRTEDTSPDPSSYSTMNGISSFQKYQKPEENDEDNDDDDGDESYMEDIEVQSDAYSLPYALKISSSTNADASTTTEANTVVVNNKNKHQPTMAPTPNTIWENDKDCAEHDDLWDGVVEACNDVTFSSIANRNATMAAIGNMTKTTDDAASSDSECDKTALADESMEVEVEAEDYYEVVCLDKKLKQTRRFRKRSMKALVCVFLVGIIVAIICGTTIPQKRQNDEPQTQVSEAKGEDKDPHETTTTSGKKPGGVKGEKDGTDENGEKGEKGEKDDKDEKDEKDTTTSGKKPGGEQNEKGEQDEKVDKASKDDPVNPPSPPTITPTPGENESDFDLPQSSPSFPPSFFSSSFSSSSSFSVSSSSSSFSSSPSSSPVPDSTFTWNVNDNTNDNNNQEDVVVPPADNVFAGALGGGLDVYPIVLMNHEDTIDASQPKLSSGQTKLCIKVHLTGNLGVYHGGCPTSGGATRRRRSLLTTTIFETKCAGGSTGKYYAKLQGDGNLFVFPGSSSTGRTGSRLWKSKIVGASNKEWFLGLNQDSTLSIYEGTGPLDKGPELWSSSMGTYECYGQEL